jgi:hypothetical protein
MSKSARYAEAFFGGIAKGTLVVVGRAALVLGVLGGGLTELPTTRKEWGYFLLIILIALVGFILFIEHGRLVSRPARTKSANNEPARGRARFLKSVFLA